MHSNYYCRLIDRIISSFHNLFSLQLSYQTVKSLCTSPAFWNGPIHPDSWSSPISFNLYAGTWVWAPTTNGLPGQIAPVYTFGADFVYHISQVAHEPFSENSLLIFLETDVLNNSGVTGCAVLSGMRLLRLIIPIVLTITAMFTLSWISSKYGPLS